MEFLNRCMAVLAICITAALLCCITPGLLQCLIVVLVTCAALAASVVFNRGKKLVRLTSKIPAASAQVAQLNASVYELYRPQGEPSMEVAFFHGFQHGDYKNAHLSTWKCRDASSVWPQTWLVEKFGNARILSVSYNASVMKSCETGPFDMYIIGENLISDLLHANIGQEPCRPVVLVGHSFGGLVIKQICTHASSQTGGLKRNSERSLKLSTFLENIKGIFFYSTPHHGVTAKVAEHFLGKSPLLEYVTTLSTTTARLNSMFDNLWGQEGRYKTWQIAGLGESLPTKSGSFRDQVVVQEASSRYGTNFNIVAEADHISVCRPMKKTCRSFSALTTFLESISVDSQAIVHGLPSYPTALERRALEVQQMLSNTPILGMVGMGGIGKTTIAKEVFNNISRQFEYTCFVDNVKGIKIHKLDDWVRNRVLRSGTKPDGNSIQWPQLQGKKILIVMDDVDSEIQLKALPKFENLGTGSRLIITSRYQSVLNRFPNCSIFEVKLLDLQEARMLFCRHAFSQDGTPDHLLRSNHHLQENVERMVQKCDGLPLTLEIMGCYLRGQEKHAKTWEQTIDKLGKAEPVDGIRNDRLWASLRLSFDALSTEEQEMFMEAGTYFFQQPVERAIAAWNTAYGNSETRWANLLRTSMVKEVQTTKWVQSWSKYTEYTEVWVHEQLRDLASILLKGTMISSSVRRDRNPWDVLISNEVGAQTKILYLEYYDVWHCPELQLELLDKLENLKYLDLVHVLHDGSRNNLSRKLCLLTWSSKGQAHGKARPIFSFSLEDMNNLAILELKRWEIPEEVLEAVGKLINLRILSLSRIQAPACLPENFGHLRQLKQLKLDSIPFTSLPHSFGNLSALEHLVLSRVEVVELPESFGNLSSLTTLVIDRCEKLASLPESFGHLSSLTELVIRACPCLNCLQPTEMPHFDLCENLPSLRSLRLHECDRLERLPASFELLSSLEELELSSCCKLKMLPKTFGQFKALKSLKISGAPDLNALPDSFGNLAALTYLRLANCSSLERLPASFGNLSALQELVLHGCHPNFQRLPDNFSQLMALKKLTIYEVDKLESLPDDFGNLASLTSLYLTLLPLETLPESFGLLSALQDLDLSVCQKLDRLPDNFGQLVALQKLTIIGTRIMALPESFCNLPALEDLDLAVRQLPDKLGQLSTLKKLCTDVSCLPDSLGDLISLEELIILEGGLQSLPVCIGHLLSLRKLDITARSLQSLPEELGNLSSLEDLKVNCERIRTLPDSLGHISTLRNLMLNGLPYSFG